MKILKKAYISRTFNRQNVFENTVQICKFYRVCKDCVTTNFVLDRIFLINPYWKHTYWYAPNNLTNVLHVHMVGRFKGTLAIFWGAKIRLLLHAFRKNDVGRVMQGSWCNLSHAVCGSASKMFDTVCPRSIHEGRPALYCSVMFWSLQNRYYTGVCVEWGNLKDLITIRWWRYFEDSALLQNMRKSIKKNRVMEIRTAFGISKMGNEWICPEAVSLRNVRKINKPMANRAPFRMAWLHLSFIHIYKECIQ